MVTHADATVIDMTLEGAFAAPPVRSNFGQRLPFTIPRSAKLLVGLVLAALALSAVLMVWLAIQILPVLILFLAGSWMFRRWRRGSLPRPWSTFRRA